MNDTTATGTPRCQGLTKTGKQCSKAAQSPSVFCTQHFPIDPATGEIARDAKRAAWLSVRATSTDKRKGVITHPVGHRDQLISSKGPARRARKLARARAAAASVDKGAKLARARAKAARAAQRSGMAAKQ